jgi:hypothetical protein
MRRRPVAPDPRTFSRFYAASRRTGLKLAKYVLCPFGLDSDSVGNIIVDHTIALAQGHPEGNLYLCPLTGKPQPTASVAWYYADCIAYEHDIPVIVLPTRGDFERFGYRYAHSGRTTPKVVHVANLENDRTITHTFPALSAKRLVKESYGESLCSILESVREIRQGPLTFIDFRHKSRNGTLNLAYTSKYSSVAQEIHLYSVALRQADSLSEFLCYYRVIESATQSNGKTWIASSLDALSLHDFGNIVIGHNSVGYPRRNLLSIWRSRALRRLSVLRHRLGSADAVASYLYNTNRCGIAHGKVIVRADITPSYFEVVRDTYVLKLLARLAIDQKV